MSGHDPFSERFGKVFHIVAPVQVAKWRRRRDWAAIRKSGRVTAAAVPLSKHASAHWVARLLSQAAVRMG
jgi:hypothetical protein